MYSDAGFIIHRSAFIIGPPSLALTPAVQGKGTSWASRANARLAVLKLAPIPSLCPRIAGEGNVVGIVGCFPTRMLKTGYFSFIFAAASESLMVRESSLFTSIQSSTRSVHARSSKPSQSGPIRVSSVCGGGCLLT